MASVFLFLAVYYLLRAPILNRQFDRSRCLIALISAALWSLNPIQTQAVTYIVQRMASMAAMFYMLSMLFYIKCRMSRSSMHRILLMLGCILNFLLALGSKENAVALPAALLLIEVIFFQRFDWRFSRMAYLGVAIVGGLLMVLIGKWLSNCEVSFSFLNGYESRPFTLAERLLTEPRIVLYYLSQILYPIPGRLSIEHDVVLSTSLLQPWTTLPAIILTLLLVGWGFCQVRRRPLMALAILFFFLNHIIESSIIPLELIFEHRNYLPSMFLFLPLAAGFKWLYDYYLNKNRILSVALAGFLLLFMVGLGSGTYIRNLDWATELSLWRDAMIKAPQSARPLTNIAWQLAYGPAARPSQYDTALKLYQKALFLQKPRSFSEPVIMNNMAGIYFKKGESQKAIDLLEKALAISPAYTRGRYDLVKILIADGRWQTASEHVDYLLSKHGTHDRYLNLKGLILLHLKQYNAAIDYFRKALTAAPFYNDALMNLGIVYSLKEDFGSAEIYFRRAHRFRPKNMLPLLGLIENTIKAGDVVQAKEYADHLISLYKMSAVREQLFSISTDKLRPPLSPALILAFMESQNLDHAEEISLTRN